MLLYIQKVENQDPLVIFQETVDEPNLDAAKDRAARRLKNSQIAEHIPVVIFRISQDGKIVYSAK
jgi:hypothetical protein